MSTTMSRERLYLFDTTLRDGAQTNGVDFSLHDKRMIATLLDDLGIALSPRGNIGCGSDWQTEEPGVFVCGDAHRGASLIVWAIAEGRAAAAGVDKYLMGQSALPAPIRPTAAPQR